MNTNSGSSELSQRIIQELHQEVFYLMQSGSFMRIADEKKLIDLYDSKYNIIQILEFTLTRNYFKELDYVLRNSNYNLRSALRLANKYNNIEMTNFINQKIAEKEKERQEATDPEIKEKLDLILNDGEITEYFRIFTENNKSSKMEADSDESRNYPKTRDVLDKNENLLNIIQNILTGDDTILFIKYFNKMTELNLYDADYNINDVFEFIFKIGLSNNKDVSPIINHILRNSKYDTTIALRTAGEFACEDMINYIIQNLLGKSYVPYASICYGACERGHTPIVKHYYSLLQDKKKKLFVNEFLHASCKGGNQELVEMFINEGAVDIKTALSTAEKYKNDNVHKYLSEINIETIKKIREANLKKEESNSSKNEASDEVEESESESEESEESEDSNED